MAPPNLTREQAAERAAILSVDNYSIELDLTDGAGAPGTTTFRSVTTVRFDATAGASTFIDLIAKTVHSATLNGEPVDVSGYSEETGIALTGLAAHNELVVDADCLYTNTGEGLHRFVDPTDDAVYLYSQFETADAKRMFACFDQPDLKATFDLKVTAPQDWAVISNADTVQTAAAQPGLHIFRTTPRMSTYLVALIAGPYAVWSDEYTDEHGTIPLRIFCRASLAEYMDADRLFTETKQGFGFYHANFGIPYAFGKYDQLFVPEFNAGAMENAGAVTFLEDYVFRSKVTRYSYERRAETVLHEMAHMWFGDLVTMRWWDDLWLNESFATFASVLCQASATEYTNAWTTFANVEKSWAYRQDQLPSTHPIAADIPDLAAVEVNFDGITYAKGASVLKQLVAYVGQEPFLAGLREYFRDHAYGNATFDDLLAALEKASGRDLSDWGAQWLKTTGLNILRPDFEVDDQGRFTRFAVVQEGAQPGAGEFRVHRLAIGVYDDDGSGKLVRTHRVEIDVDAAERTEVPDLVGVPRGAFVLVNDDDLTYCSVRLDEESLATVIDRVGDIAESLPRTLVWSAAWEMTRQAEMKARDFVALVQRGIAAETEVGVVQRLLMQAHTALESYADPSWAAEQGRADFANRLLELARESEAGSDHQLAFVNALTTAYLSPWHTEVLEELLGADPATVGLPGLTVDTDLRWRIVQALAAAGEVDAEGVESPFIDAEAERDPTAAGARQAAAARAARPQEAVKEQVWQTVVHDDSVPNITARAVIGGFAPAGQGELLEPYVARYFAEVPGVWERRSSEVAQTVVIGLYPSWSINEQSVAAADEFLAGDHPPALRRLVVEGRAGVVRSLKARAFDAS
ncbi:Membrane alanyl aminopeptidase . Metallo peptidase. MEROPS family M01 [Rhodococcus rhodochrous J3]|uniref:Aminopeptidase N n=1 Tax=Rhodococcus rhodochrous J3 TaxID=903528 RepID=A0ABY1M3Z9_RHORH|nr:aminopeptidase N [Rhodococcus rhodochrous]AYA25964.1 aminopeptidase N [Rhodococcus rhodochrous]MCB8912168.1 aminopeptidase N [Rhodococcus rhodochrous]MDJ0396908.1 aminopeptidase N [Rhodococcus rhodochrous]SMG05994.1 Membrane alanyl aminopeptidase . Metallo peptidase. MEROPS family M01 [Rhodococcus rhodochrous J3]